MKKIYFLLILIFSFPSMAEDKELDDVNKIDNTEIDVDNIQIERKRERRKNKDRLRKDNSKQDEEYIDEYKSGNSNFDKMRNDGEKHPIESVGQKLRSMMPWISANKLVDKNKN